MAAAINCDLGILQSTKTNNSTRASAYNRGNGYHDELGMDPLINTKPPWY
jgi:hypothetical protein